MMEMSIVIIVISPYRKSISLWFFNAFSLYENELIIGSLCWMNDGSWRADLNVNKSYWYEDNNKKKTESSSLNIC